MSIRLSLARLTVAGLAATLGVAGLVGYAAADATTSTPAAVSAPAAPQSAAATTAKAFGISISGAVKDRGKVSRLVVPGDAHGARYVFDLSKITLVRLGSGGIHLVGR